MPLLLRTGLKLTGFRHRRTRRLENPACERSDGGRNSASSALLKSGSGSRHREELGFSRPRCWQMCELSAGHTFLGGHESVSLECFQNEGQHVAARRKFAHACSYRKGRDPRSASCTVGVSSSGERSERENPCAAGDGKHSPELSAPIRNRGTGRKTEAAHRHRKQRRRRDAHGSFAARTQPLPARNDRVRPQRRSLSARWRSPGAPHFRPAGARRFNRTPARHRTSKERVDTREDLLSNGTPRTATSVSRKHTSNARTDPRRCSPDAGLRLRGNL